MAFAFCPGIASRPAQSAYGVVNLVLVALIRALRADQFGSDNLSSREGQLRLCGTQFARSHIAARYHGKSGA